LLNMATIKIFCIVILFQIAYCNNVNKTTSWTRGINARFANMTSDQLKMFLGAKKPENLTSTFPVSVLPSGDSLPDSFYAYDKWKYCKDSIMTVRDRSACGSCWAAASASAMSDLTCIKYKGERSPYISEEDLLSCCETKYESTCGNCGGGYVNKAFDYWNYEGVVTGGAYNSKKGCQPYTIPPLMDLHGRTAPSMPGCYESCQGSYQKSYYDDKLRGKWTSYTVKSVDMRVDEMKRAIYNYGPIVVMIFKVYEDFQTTYKGGVYERDYGSPFKGYHAAKVIGWGRDENNTPYWLAVNSWGSDWGQNGFFKMKLGTNECGFEEGAIYGEALGDDPAPPVPTRRTHSAGASTLEVGRNIALFSLIAITIINAFLYL